MAVYSSLFVLCFLLFLQDTVQLHCARRMVEAAFGSTFTLVCQYNTESYLSNRKYWCREGVRTKCNMLMDTNGFTERELKGRFEMRDKHNMGLFIEMKNLQFSDTGHYWVGIEKGSEVIMSRISITVTEVPVSEPRLQFVSPVTGTCWGEPLTVRCSSDQGTNLRYSWYKTGSHGSISLGVMKDLQLHCDVVGDGDLYYCRASNSVSSRQSPSVSVQLLQSAEENCVYILTAEGEEQYDCWERRRTSTAPYQDTTRGPNFVYQSTSVTYTEEINVSLRIAVAVVLSEVTMLSPAAQHRVRTGMPVWYEALRWLLFTSLLTAVCLVRKCCKHQS